MRESLAERSVHTLPHAEVARAAGPRSTRILGASFEARPPASPDSRAPQDEDVGRVRPPSDDRLLLRAIAHSRTGDKGDTSNISVIAFDEADYGLLLEHVTVERVRAHLGDVVRGSVTRYELPAIGALNFVLTGTLGGGVTRSLALDAHGKALSSALLDLEIPRPTGRLEREDS